MRAPTHRPRFSVDEYLARERATIERNMFLDGEIIAMAGESDAHGDISTNLVGTLVPQLKGTRCRARTKDTKVRSALAPLPGTSMRGLFCYPDIVVICGQPEYHDAYEDVILNPTAILEVLSPSTEAYDRGIKFARYQTCNPSLQEYVLVSQDRPYVEVFSRQPDGSWLYRIYSGLDQSAAIPSIGCTLKLADVYDRVVFAAE